MSELCTYFPQGENGSQPYVCKLGFQVYAQKNPEFLSEEERCPLISHLLRTENCQVLRSDPQPVELGVNAVQPQFRQKVIDMLGIISVHE